MKEPWWQARVRYYRTKATPKLTFEQISFELGRSVNDCRAVMGLGPMYRAELAEPPKDGEPMWAKRARYLRRSKKMSIQKIADEIGQPYSRVYKALHPRRKRASDARYQARLRRDRSMQRRELRIRTAPPCSLCGAPMSSTRAESLVCLGCRKDRSEKRMKRVVDMWNEGLSVKQIVEITDYTPNIISSLVSEARKRGWEVRRARQPKKKKKA